MALDRVRVHAGETVKEDFDLGPALPAVWHGRVVVAGDSVPMHRLRVVAFADGGPSAMWSDLGVHSATWRTIPDADGRFSLLLAPGTHGLRVEDLLTGVRLGQLQPVKLASRAEHEQDIKISVARARVQFVPRDGGQLVAERLLVRAGDAPDEEAPLAFFDTWRGAGLSLSCAPSEVDIFVPPGSTRLRVVIDRARLAHGDPSTPDLAELAELWFEAAVGAPQVLKLEVDPPPDLPQ
jgi:hypothetical protein